MSADTEIRQTRDRVLEDGVILCVRMGKGDAVLDACRAAARGGLRTFEITLTTPGALAVIAELSREAGLLVGAGTVLVAEQVDRVAGAGGRFVLSPVFDRDVVDAAGRRGLLAIPGAATPKEIVSAHRYGAMLVKVFPAGALGGPDFIRTVRGPLADIPLIPTGGPTAQSIGDYVDAGAVAVGVGRDVFPPDFTLEVVEQAARNVRNAMDPARGKRHEKSHQPEDEI